MAISTEGVNLCSGATIGFQTIGLPALEGLSPDCAKIHIGNTEPVALTASDLPSSRQLFFLVATASQVSWDSRPEASLSAGCLFAPATTKGVFPWICNL